MEIDMAFKPDPEIRLKYIIKYLIDVLDDIAPNGTVCTHREGMLLANQAARNGKRLLKEWREEFE
jgi:hypothetical protein